MQEADAEHRMKVLRARAGGADAPALEGRDQSPTTDIARRFVAPKDGAQIDENEAAIVRRTTPPPPDRRRRNSPTLAGADGHINLFSDIENPKRQNRIEKNAEHEAEKKAKEAKLEAQYTMGLGKPAEELKPWYSTLDMVGEVKGRKKTDREMKKDERSKDWGDPLAAIKRGVRGVKEVEETRKEWKRTRELEVGAVGLCLLGAERVGGGKRARSRSRESKKKRDRSPETHHDRSKRRSRSTSKGGHRNYSHKRNRPELSTETASRRHQRHHRSSRSRSPHREPNSQNDLMERLRRERDQREKAEREKAEVMLSKEKEYRLPGWKAASGGRYSSQFGIGEVRKR